MGPAGDYTGHHRLVPTGLSYPSLGRTSPLGTRKEGDPEGPDDPSYVELRGWKRILYTEKALSKNNEVMVS